MIDDIKVFLRGENVSHDQANPTIGTIKGVVRIPKDDLKFKSKADRYEMSVEINGLDQAFMPNKTSMRNLMVGFGPDELKWVGRKVVIYSKEQVIDEKTCWVVKVEPMPGA